MASKASAKSATNLPVFSRFSVLEEDSSNSSEEEKSREENKNAESKKMSKSAKKRARKKKRTASDSAESEQLRNMAFRAKPLIKGNHPIAALHVNTTQLHTTEEKPSDIGIEEQDPMSWEVWRERDEKFVMDQFHQDLERALHQSIQDAKNQQKQIEEIIRLEQQKGSPKKEQPVRMSLLEFQTLPPSSDTQPPVQNGTYHTVWPDEIEDGEMHNGIHTTYNNDLEEDNTSSQKREKKKKKKKKAVAETNANGLEDWVESEPSHPTEEENDKKIYDLDPASIAQWRYEVEKKDKIIEEMNSDMELMKTELSQVKKRNKQLCFILGQGEMKDKSDLLQQIEELTAVKDELSAELSEMHSALEQERSKVSSLKQEVAKHQTRVELIMAEYRPSCNNMECLDMKTYP